MIRRGAKRPENQVKHFLAGVGGPRHSIKLASPIHGEGGPRLSIKLASPIHGEGGPRLSIKLASPIYGGGGPRSGGRGCYIKRRPHSFTIYHLNITRHESRQMRDGDPHNTLTGATYSFQLNTHWRAGLMPICNTLQIPLLMQVYRDKGIPLKQPAPSRVFTGSLSHIVWLSPTYWVALKQPHIHRPFSSPSIG